MQFKQLTDLVEAMSFGKQPPKNPKHHEERREGWVMRWDETPRADGTFSGIMFNEKDPTQAPTELKGYKSWQEIRDVFDDKYDQIADSFVSARASVNLDFNRELGAQVFHNISSWFVDVRVIDGVSTLLVSDTEFVHSKRVIDRRSTTAKAAAKEGEVMHGTTFTTNQFSKTGLDRRTRYTLGEQGEIPDDKGGTLTTFELIQHSRFTGNRLTLKVPALYTT